MGSSLEFEGCKTNFVLFLDTKVEGGRMGVGEKLLEFVG
jgi:hypothetical protein